MSTARSCSKRAAELFPDEVVTQAHVRHVDLPGGAGRLALITLDNGFDHTKPTTFGPAGLAALDAAIDEALGRDDVVAVAVTGKPFIFAVGADLTGVAAAAATATQALRHRPARPRRLPPAAASSAVPTFAFVNGAAMGGGLELALHCHYRTVSAGVPALALPEVLPRPGPRLGRHASCCRT